VKKLFETRPIDITGNLLAYKDGQPVFLNIEGHCFIAIFSTVEKLHMALREMQIWDYKIKQIDDGFEFIDSLEGKVRIARDPWTTEQKTVRFTEVVPSEQGRLTSEQRMFLKFFN
jgi:hypothetical protein